MKRNVLYRAVCVYISMLLGLTACMDDEIRSANDIPEGETTINAVVNFNALTPALATRATAGDAIKNIETLWVLIYDQDGKFLKKYSKDDFLNYDDSKVVKHDMDSHSKIAESETQQVTFGLRIPYGIYRMYAVANVNLANACYQEAIQTVEGLKGIAFEWNESNVASNNQMFGYFTEENVLSDNSETIRIDRRGKTFEARIRRLASKVTIAFDGSELYEGVSVYIKSAQIKDIPASCFLGKPNDEKAVKSEADLIENGDVIQYAETGASNNDDESRCIAKGSPYYPRNAKNEASFHSETEPALFFYENMQGVGKDKKQDPAYMGEKKKGEDGYKDNKPYGTYIEVKAYYHSINPGKVGAGEIVYRFMLGKDVKSDFNAERNHHYKLTLKFKNYANDVDWHIDYKQEEVRIDVPAIYYISPLYNDSLMFPLQVYTGGYELVDLKADIDTNSWAPWGAPDDHDYYYYEMDPYKWNPKADRTLQNYAGFLSLRRSTETVVEGTDDAAHTNLKNYYDNNNQGWRAYMSNGQKVTTDINKAGSFSAKQVNENEWNFQVPMYTRAKQLIIASAYTGNNPFEQFQRRSVVTFTATLKAGNTTKQIKNSCVIMQERRIVNPTGVWRKWNNSTPFHVELKSLRSYAAMAEFYPFTSKGKWKAYVYKGDKSFMKDTVFGSTNSTIEFDIQFNQNIAKNENRYAIIRVDFHDYSCHHLIFVRKGDEPEALTQGGRRWLIYNMRTGSKLAESPCEEGSMFRFGKKNFPIDATENMADALGEARTTKFTIAEKAQGATWDEIGYINSTSNFGVDDITGKPAISVATYADFSTLFNAKDIEQGYGILYGNDATGTQDLQSRAYEYRYNGDKSYGMRGCFVYNKNDGRHIFFPIGASGYGRRQDNNEGKKAALRYASNTADYLWKLAERAPLLFDLHKRMGAIYWLRTDYSSSETDYEPCNGWDFNYFSFDFNHIKKQNFNNGKDAVFVRCVIKEENAGDYNK